MSADTYAKHILFITSSRIGDAVLSFGILEELRRQNPEARFTIVCGPLVTSFFEGFPQLQRIIALKKQKYNKHWFDLWRQLVGTPFDIVVDLRNSAVSRAIRARKRYIYGNRIDQAKHKVEQNAQVIGLKQPASPTLWFSDAQLEKAKTLIPDGAPVLGIGPTANWAGKTWPADRFIEIINWMTASNGLMPDARVAIFAAPGEEDAARHILSTIPPERALDLIAKTDPATAAACLSRCGFYIGNDSGLMHCAAAAGVPTLGLFGPSYPHLYKPWGSRASFIATPESYDQLITYEGYNPKTVGSLMTNLSVDKVKAALNENWPLITTS